MSLINKPEITYSRRQIPTSAKLILLLAVIIGIWMRSCWLNYQKENIQFTDIKLESATPVSVDVTFNIDNKSLKSGKHRIFIEVFTSRNEVIAKKLTFVDISSKSKKGYIKVIDKFSRPLFDDETLTHARVTLDQ